MPLTGFSHGASGFAYAMMSLAQETNSLEFRNAAEQCVEFENDVYSNEGKNWPDFRYSRGYPYGETNFLRYWCHGAPGIGLARIGMRKFGNYYPKISEQSINIAVDQILDNWPSVWDQNCCGNMGNIQLLLEVATGFNDPNLLQNVRVKVTSIINRSKINGRYSFPLGSENKYNLGMFIGVSGIGYSILRLINPNKIPNILIFE
jgi:lantibiotic modifying enzyme